MTVQILPFSAGAHPAMTAPFVLLGLDDHPGMNTVYLENGRGALYLEGAADLTKYDFFTSAEWAAFVKGVKGGEFD